MGGRYFMNPAHGRHINEGAEGDIEGREPKETSGADGHVPHIHIHPHHDEEGRHTHTTVHIMHHDGRHEKHEHEHGDSDGIAEHVHRHLAAEPGESREEAEREESSGESRY